MTTEVQPLPVQKWVRVTHTPTGTRVSVTLRLGHAVVRWTEKSYITSLREDLAAAESNARGALDRLIEGEVVKRASG